MSDDARDMAKAALQKTLKSALAKAKERAANPRPKPEARVDTSEYEEIDKPLKGSEDALDRKGFSKGGFSKAQKREYAQKMFAEELLSKPKEPPPAWLNDPSLLPKRPPGRINE